MNDPLYGGGNKTYLSKHILTPVFSFVNLILTMANKHASGGGFSTKTFIRGELRKNAGAPVFGK
jgi:hypothetical protein